MPRDVRTHTRRTATGKTTTVRHHQRKGKRGPNPGHAWHLTRRSRVHHRRGRKGKAAMLLAVAGVEVLAWFTFSTTAWVCTLIAGVLVLISTLLTW